MIFQSRYRNAQYVVRRSFKNVHPDGSFEVKWGLKAKFTGPNRLFDSVSAQRELGWTDKDRKQVEDHLIHHKDYGHGLYLAPGEELTATQRKLIQDPSLQTPAKRRCQAIWTEGQDIKQCDEECAVGNEYCDAHRKDTVQIVKNEGLVD